jgi:ferritin-like metal-binding protein YciE
MADQSAAATKLVQYLTEAHGKEKELETSLAAHIELAERPAYKKRLKQHLKETKQHARLVERRLKKLGGGGIAQTLTDAASRGVAAAKGPLHGLRGTGVEEKQLKNAKTEYSEEHEEIAMYTAIETLAEQVGDTETAKLARGIRREEERMAAFLEKQIPVLTKAVAKAEIPASERKTATSRRRSSSRSGGSGSRKSTKSSKSTKSKKSSGSGSRSRSSSKSGGSKSSSRSRSSGSGSRRSSGSRSS